MRPILLVLTVLATWAWPLATGLDARQQTAPRKPEPPKAAPSVAGKWTMTVNANNGPIIATLDAKLDGKAVSGTIASDMGQAPVAGEYADGKLTFSLSMPTADGGAMDLTFSGAMQDNGTLAGTMTMATGTALNWTAERVKTEEQKATPPAKPAAAV